MGRRRRLSTKQRIDQLRRGYQAFGGLWLLYALLRALGFRGGMSGLERIERERFQRESAPTAPQCITPITKKEFRACLEQYPSLLGEYYENRWPYLSRAIEVAMSESPESILELGAAYLPLFRGSDCMDLKDYTPRLTCRHDLTDAPWPLADSQYDLIVGLQVWEHLGDKQAEAFREVMRVADKAILSFPYKWNCPHDPEHHAIDDEKIAAWTLNHPPARRELVEGRILYLFDFR